MTLSEDLRRRVLAAGRAGYEADVEAMRRAAYRGIPLADFEDADGRLPGDELYAVLLDRVRELKS